MFSSITFLFLFLPASILIYFAVPNRFRNIVLLAESMIFFLWAEPLSLVIIALLTCVNYFCGISMYRFQSDRNRQRLILWGGIGVNLLLIFVFKYQMFLPILQSGIVRLNIDFTGIIVPLGISVFTFQGLSYIIDLYQHKIQVQKKFVRFALYMFFFPQSVCGPIVRYNGMVQNLGSRRINQNIVARGYGIFIRGLAKKIILADTMMMLWGNIKTLDFSKMSVLTAWLGVFSFGFGIYFYFSGYSEMARGIAKIFGFELPINFNYPYMSKSVVDFWRRWNITLTVWYKTYLINPLGRNSDSALLTLFKVLLLWSVMGIWYGSTINYLFWGFLIGVFVIIEKLFLSTFLEKLPAFLQRFYALLVISIGWVFFAFEDIARVPQYIRAMFFGNGLPFSPVFTGADNMLYDASFLYLAASYGLIFIICTIASTNLEHNFILKQEHKNPAAAAWMRIGGEVVLTLLCALSVVSGHGRGMEVLLNF